MVPSRSRREFLRIGSVGVAALTAGCSSVLGANEDTAETRTLGGLSLASDYPERLTLAVFVLRDGDRVYWDSHELLASEDSTDSELVRPPAFEAAKGRHVLGARVRSLNESRVWNLGEQFDAGGCLAVEVRVSEDGALALGQLTNTEEYANCSTTE